MFFFFFFSSRRRHTRLQGDWSSDVCSSDLITSASPSTKPTRWRPEKPMVFSTAYSRVRSRTDMTMVLASTRRIDRKSTRLNSSHLVISYAVFCLKKKKKYQNYRYNEAVRTY